MKYPDYANNILNLACSMARHFDLATDHPGLPTLDRLLERDYKHVVLLLFDGMGTDTMARHLEPNGFLRRHLRETISSVFPPTTTASTTTAMTGLSPAQHGWLGWSLYFHELDDIINLYPNTYKYEEDVQPDYPVAFTALPFTDIVSRINDTGTARAFTVSPFGPKPIAVLEELFARTGEICSMNEPTYLYGYWPYPDSLMHEKGCYHNAVGKNVREIERRLERLCASLTDTLVVVTADHGLVDTGYHKLSDCPELAAMQSRPLYLEPRAAMFSLKPECVKDFPAAFRARFGKEFLLLCREEILAKGLFGPGAAHPRFKGFLGDYLAIAVGGMGLVQDKRCLQLTANHAGLTGKEVDIPFIAID